MIRVYTTHPGQRRLNLEVVTRCPAIALAASEALSDNGFRTLTCYARENADTEEAPLAYLAAQGYEF